MIVDATIEEALMPRHHDVRDPGAPRALLLTPQIQTQTDEEHERATEELGRLATTLGLEVVGVETQKLERLSPATYVGSGRLREIAERTGGKGEPPKFGSTPEADVSEDEEEAGDADESAPTIDLVVTLHALDARLLHTLEYALGVEVLDRVGLILEIFERRARTNQARVELEIARLRYELPRLRRATKKRGRTGGGGGRGERGNTAAAMGRERIRMRIDQLEGELEGMRKGEKTRRSRRERIYQVALVGYTNAGKSSLMRGLTGSGVYVQDELFATLGTTARRLDPPVSPPLVVSDTVGFIQDLPHELVSSFHSTLAEAADADLVLHVLDASSPSWPQHMAVTREALETVGVEADRVQLVFNKCDQLHADQRAELRDAHPDAWQTSAHDEGELGGLRASILGAQREGFSEETLRVPWALGAVRAEIFDAAHVLEERHDEEGSWLRVRADARDLERWRKRLGASPPPVSASGA
jgi:GTP-binding protein HflX